MAKKLTPKKTLILVNHISLTVHPILTSFLATFSNVHCAIQTNFLAVINKKKKLEECFSEV